jgi:hypothetical protein
MSPIFCYPNRGATLGIDAPALGSPAFLRYRNLYQNSEAMMWGWPARPPMTSVSITASIFILRQLRGALRASWVMYAAELTNLLALSVPPDESSYQDGWALAQIRQGSRTDAGDLIKVMMRIEYVGEVSHGNGVRKLQLASRAVLIYAEGRRVLQLGYVRLANHHQDRSRRIKQRIPHLVSLISGLPGRRGKEERRPYQCDRYHRRGIPVRVQSIHQLSHRSCVDLACFFGDTRWGPESWLPTGSGRETG